MEKADQIRLIQMAEAGDSAAFSALYQEYHDKIDCLCFKFLQDREETDDIVQDTFTTSFQNLSYFSCPIPFPA